MVWPHRRPPPQLTRALAAKAFGIPVLAAAVVPASLPGARWVIFGVLDVGRVGGGGKYGLELIIGFYGIFAFVSLVIVPVAGMLWSMTVLEGIRRGCVLVLTCGVLSLLVSALVLLVTARMSA